jgi:nitroreductase
MDVLEAIKKRQTIRAYKTLPVDDKILNTILDAGRLAPSWANSQTGRFIVVKDKNIIAQLLENAVAPGNRATNAF